ncbi:CGNR zinc finger domain-containing protein [Paractinoplanes globisporus]|uniref:CGNR zinc finger domain-containing protein n=1 Tax=Paractinoplanes globisporus TaxID=113565 RepID=A0ABW6W5R9_9ACTN|nr:CGNR zinc finger domain-containing protein [Actinoplanes globisporus]
MTDEGTLLALLNSTPVIAGAPTDELADDSANRWLREHRIPARAEDAAILREGRDLLQAVVRGERPPSALAPLLDGVVSRPAIGERGLIWTVDLHGARAVLVHAIEAWDELRRTRPGRLRPCANEECARFLIDHSKSNSARWCSMATCGNKLKARRHYQRIRTGDDPEV